MQRIKDKKGMDSQTCFYIFCEFPQSTLHRKFHLFHSVFYSFIQQFLSPNYVPGTAVGTKNIAVNKTDELYPSLIGNTNTKKHLNKNILLVAIKTQAHNTDLLLSVNKRRNE